MSGNDPSDFSPGDGLIVEGLREGILAALQRDDLDPEDRKQLQAALVNLDSESASAPQPPPANPPPESEPPATA